MMFAGVFIIEAIQDSDMNSDGGYPADEGFKCL
jgi:hypothetical protein